MEIPENLTYPDVSGFLQGKTDLLKLKDLEKKSPVYGIFDFLKKSQNIHKSPHGNIDLTFSKAEEYLEKYLAGNLTKQNANELEGAILHSEKNFKKLNHLIEQHTLALTSYNDPVEYKKAMADKDILIHLLRLRDKKPEFTPNVYGKKVALGLVAIAAIFFLLIVLPLQINKELDDLYNFDKDLPLYYKSSTLRGAKTDDVIKDPDYNRFRYQFYKGMTEYLAREYASALAEWQDLEKDISKLENTPFFKEEDKRDFLLYNAVCRIALYLSDNENLSETEKNRILHEALKFFKKLPLYSDAERYYYALALGLAGRDANAKQILSSINNASEYYPRKIILEDHLHR